MTTSTDDKQDDNIKKRIEFFRNKNNRLHGNNIKCIRPSPLEINNNRLQGNNIKCIRLR